MIHWVEEEVGHSCRNVLGRNGMDFVGVSSIRGGIAVRLF